VKPSIVPVLADLSEQSNFPVGDNSKSSTNRQYQAAGIIQIEIGIAAEIENTWIRFLFWWRFRPRWNYIATIACGGCWQAAPSLFTVVFFFERIWGKNKKTTVNVFRFIHEFACITKASRWKWINPYFPVAFSL